MKRLIIDIDSTLTLGDTSDYVNVGLNIDVANQLHAYKKEGFEIVLYTSRNMRTHNSSIGKITAHTLPVILEWLKKHDVPYDEIWVGKPWCGHQGFYVDDKAIRPDEFINMSYDEICDLIGLLPEKDKQ